MKNNFKLLMNNNSKMKKANKLNKGANTFEFCLPSITMTFRLPLTVKSAISTK